MVNIDRLKTVLQDKNITVEHAANAIGVNPATFYRRLNRHGAKFTVYEVGKLAELLNLDGDMVQSIFFSR